MKASKPQSTPASGLDGLISTLSKRLRKALADPDASLKQTVALATEVRKLEALKRKQATEITMVQVVTWLKQQTSDDRARVARELASMERRGGVLG